MRKIHSTAYIIGFLIGKDNYQNLRVYLKTMLLIFIVWPLFVVVTLAIVTASSRKQLIDNTVRKKVQEHQLKVKAGMEKFSKELDSREQELKKTAAPLIAKKDSFYLNNKETLEYIHTDKQERLQKYFNDKDIMLLDYLDWLATGKERKYDWLEAEPVEKSMNCYGIIVEWIKYRKTEIVAKKKLAEQYRGKVELLESRLQRQGYLDDWDLSEYNAKKSYVMEADSLDLNADEAEFIRQIMASPPAELTKCLQRAPMVFPLAMYHMSLYWGAVDPDEPHQLMRRSKYYKLRQFKKTSELFGIAKDFDWTIPSLYMELEFADDEILQQRLAALPQDNPGFYSGVYRTEEHMRVRDRVKKIKEEKIQKYNAQKFNFRFLNPRKDRATYKEIYVEYPYDKDGKRGAIYGNIKVIDANTISIGNKKYRSYGTIAPTLDEICIDKKGVRWWCGLAAKHQFEYLFARANYKTNPIMWQESGENYILYDNGSQDDLSSQLILRGYAKNAIQAFDHLKRQAQKEILWVTTPVDEYHKDYNSFSDMATDSTEKIHRKNPKNRWQLLPLPGIWGYAPEKYIIHDDKEYPVFIDLRKEPPLPTVFHPLEKAVDEMLAKKKQEKM
jgi:hypothetical protein